MNYKTIKDIDIFNKNILIRVDINVPKVDERITDYTRITALLPTINYVIENGGKPILISHCGRPKGTYVASLSLLLLVSALEQVFERKVVFIDSDYHKRLATVNIGEIVLLENLRFDPREEKNDIYFAKELANLGDVYVNEAFSCSHRSHSSIDALARLLPKCAGFSFVTEINALNRIFNKPKLPLTALIGGSKISTKLELLNSLILKVDHLIIGGGMANTFLAAQGLEIGTSISEPSMLKIAKSILDKSARAGCKIHLPVDVVVADKLKVGKSETFRFDKCPKTKMILDAGPDTIKNIKSIVYLTKTLIWNGPLGAFEIKPYDKATNSVALAVAERTNSGKLISVAGGGDTVSALSTTGSAKNFSYLSTAGGAFLSWLEGKPLPGITALEEYH